MNPLKQGLKRHNSVLYWQTDNAFIHESIKTRVETSRDGRLVLSHEYAFIHESIKTRVETTHDSR